MKVIKIPETPTDPATIAASWHDAKGQKFGFFAEAKTLSEAEAKMAAEFFHAFSEIAQKFG